MKNLESMNFNEGESLVWRKWKLKKFFKDLGIWFNHQKKRTLFEWTLCILLGLFIGIIGFIVNIWTNELSNIRFQVLFNDTLNKISFTATYFSFVSVSLLYVSAAALCCYMAPEAVGSGIPEIKAYLNGLGLKSFLRFKVLIAKTIGVCFSCGSGLPIGKEGPLIHIGSIAGAAFSQGTSTPFFSGFMGINNFKNQDLRNDRNKRDYVTYGAAAGVAAAFNAPIGGILFTLEEGTSYWSQKLTIRSFITALMTQLIFSILSNIVGNKFFTKLGKNGGIGGAFEFGLFADDGFFWYELPLFAVVGFGGGLLGAFFNFINKRASEFRIANINKFPMKRYLDLLLLTFLFSSISILFPLWIGRCYPIPTETNDWTEAQLAVLGNLVQFQCNSHEFNPLASLFLTTSNTAIQNLFHFKEGDGSDFATFPSGSLLTFFLPYFLFAAVTSGTYCPAGLFVPTLLAGASYGRIIGHILNSLSPGEFSASGVYAIMGACALLGGMSRMMVAGVVIVAEASGSLNLILPFMITFACARYTGNFFNAGIYDMQIEIKKLPFIDPSLSKFGLLNYQSVYAIMASPVICFNKINQVGTVYQILRTTTHNGFPIVSESGHLMGFILRNHILVLMQKKNFISPESKEIDLVYYETLEKDYPKYPNFDSLDLNEKDMKMDIDFGAYMDTSIISINAISSIQTANRMFRALDLRHMVICDNFHHVIGIITRQNLCSKHIEETWAEDQDGIDHFVFADEMLAAKRDNQAKQDEQQEVNHFKNIMVQKYVTVASHITTATTAGQSFKGSNLFNVTSSFAGRKTNDSVRRSSMFNQSILYKSNSSIVQSTDNPSIFVPNKSFTSNKSFMSGRQSGRQSRINRRSYIGSFMFDKNLDESDESDEDNTELALINNNNNNNGNNSNPLNENLTGGTDISRNSSESDTPYSEI